ncbi:phosphatase type 2C [Salpingoeca rosetta]|uniref:Phosphatase type 2C n=1 Tax=Salpingoeca rosetta (strain ATCC 50818 / BSB-021) TaxID=946362 RepID=F2ULK5_SALR5|nr:phosphatase type 2C [Salpingoeca rosetta]EGD78004.1 phosphatase type 2C [Salpingoeca rosetta]|eukprot:XP_004990066.1 phosphatase type 2C [Salpingoeca rosetta]
MLSPRVLLPRVLGSAGALNALSGGGLRSGRTVRSAQNHVRTYLSRRHKSDKPSEEAGAETPPPPPQPKGGGRGAALAIGAVGATLIGGAVAYFMQQDPSSQKAIDEHNAAVANQGLPARKRLSRSTAVESALVHNQASKLASCHGVSEILTCWLAANDPLEDRHSEHFLGPHGVLVGMYDGHSGFQTSDALSVFLPTYVKQALEKSDSTTVQATAAALSDAFEAFDRDFTSVVPKMALETKDKRLLEAFVNPAFSGAVACVALINATGIYIANTGDCRAVLGIEQAGGRVGAAVLSNDQTGTTPSEVARIRREHPGEDKCVYRGRVLGGLQPSRAFGDSRYKWEVAAMKEIGVRVPKYSKTPPYVTAKPEVLHTSIDAQAKFLILATDGVWDVVSSDEAVQVVSKALKSGSSTLLAAAQLTKRALERYAEEGTQGDVDKLLEIQAPQARNYRDDITCSVVLLEAQSVAAEEGTPEAAAAAAQAATTPSAASNLDKPVGRTLVDIFHMQRRQQQAAGAGASPAQPPAPAAANNNNGNNGSGNGV